MFEFGVYVSAVGNEQKKYLMNKRWNNTTTLWYYNYLVYVIIVNYKL